MYEEERDILNLRLTDPAQWSDPTSHIHTERISVRSPEISPSSLEGH